MTNQDLFTRITENLQAYDQLQVVISKDTTGHIGGLHWASGDLLVERCELLAWYACSDMVIFRCDTENCDSGLEKVTLDQLKDADDMVMCDYCGQMCARLLSNGKWQSQAERDELNQVEYQKVSG